MQNDVAIRGTRDGLMIDLPEGLPFDQLLSRLAQKLEASGRFFSGAEVVVRVGRRTLAGAQETQLAELLAQTQLTLREVRVGGEASPRPGKGAAGGIWSERAAAEVAPASAPGPANAEQVGALRERPLVINRTLRSGQLIRHHGDVIILGDVNPGAEIVADGHIVVLGTLRGVAHAGAGGEEATIVTASRLQPTQLRIARHVSRPPDDDKVAAGPELARIHEGRIVIESRTGH